MSLQFKLIGIGDFWNGKNTSHKNVAEWVEILKNHNHFFRGYRLAKSCFTSLKVGFNILQLIGKRQIELKIEIEDKKVS